MISEDIATNISIFVQLTFFCTAIISFIKSIVQGVPIMGLVVPNLGWGLLAAIVIAVAVLLYAGLGP